jgi:hypothetical protein
VTARLSQCTSLHFLIYKSVIESSVSFWLMAQGLRRWSAVYTYVHRPIFFDSKFKKAMTFSQWYRLSYITALMARMSATRILSSARMSHQRPCNESKQQLISNTCGHFTNRLFFQSPVKLWNIDLFHSSLSLLYPHRYFFYLSCKNWTVRSLHSMFIFTIVCDSFLISNRNSVYCTNN